MTIVVGPGTADKRRRLSVQVNTEGATLNRDAAAKVSAPELTIPERAKREYAEAERKISARDFDGAVSRLQRAVEIAPRYAAAWNHLGTIAYQTRRYTEAEGYFRKAIEADLGNTEEARQFNVEAVLRRSNDALAHAQLGMTYLAMQKLDLAEKHLLEACKLDPAHFSHPQLHLTEVYIRKNDPRRAADQLEVFLQHHPDYPTASKMREAIKQWRAH
jgi:tetratricopeptide (TPR) repeat protein